MEECIKKPQIIIEATTTEPELDVWSYPLSEMSYIMEQIENGDRENGYKFLFYGGRLYETDKTIIID